MPVTVRTKLVLTQASGVAAPLPRHTCQGFLRRRLPSFRSCHGDKQSNLTRGVLNLVTISTSKIGSKKGSLLEVYFRQKDHPKAWPARGFDTSWVTKKSIRDGEYKVCREEMGSKFGFFY